MPRLLNALFSIICVSLMLPCLANPQTAPAYVPASTTIAILPVINQSKGKWDDLKTRQAEQGKAELTSQFGSRGFRILDDAAVTQAVTQAGIDLSQPDQRTPDNLIRIGKAAHADIVAFLLITDTHQGMRHGIGEVFGYNQREGEAKITLWVADADQGTALLDGVKAAGKSRSDVLSAPFKGGSEYSVQAVSNAVKDTLANVFKPYPVISDAAHTSSVTPAPPVPAVPAVTPISTPAAPVVPSTPVNLVSPAQVAPAPVTAPKVTHQVFLLKNNARVTGQLLRYNGFFFWVATAHGTKKINARSVAAIDSEFASNK